MKLISMGRLFALLLTSHSILILIPLLVLGIISEGVLLRFVTGGTYKWLLVYMGFSQMSIGPLLTLSGRTYDNLANLKGEWHLTN